MFKVDSLDSDIQLVLPPREFLTGSTLFCEDLWCGQRLVLQSIRLLRAGVLMLQCFKEATLDEPQFLLLSFAGLLAVEQIFSNTVQVQL